MGGIHGRGKRRQLAHHQLMSQQQPHFSPHSKTKANYKKAKISRKLVTSSISDAATASVNSEKTYEEVDDDDENYYYYYYYYE